MEDEIRKIIQMMYKKLWELRREFEEIHEYSFSRTTRPLIRGAIEPLHSMYEFPDEYVFVIDIPEADSSSITVLIKGDYLEIRAKIVEKEMIESMFHTEIRREESSYIKRILLPPDADVSYMSYRYSKGRLIINIPKKYHL